MRLWHPDLLEYLPKSQLLSQWRELNSIFKKKDNHILINYIYNYDKRYLLSYTCKVLNEMRTRNININSLENYRSYFKFELLNDYPDATLIFTEHNDEYLLCNFFNLLEKYRRGQKDFTYEIFNKLYDFIKDRFNIKNLGISKNV